MLRVRAAAAIVVLASAAGLHAAGQDTKHDKPVPDVRVVRTAGSIAIDGRLDEEVWRGAPAATGFTQTDPAEGKPETERTEVRAAYDDSALYVGARLYDREPAKISRQLSRRDQEAEADWFSLYLDPHHDHLTGAVFRVSAGGVQSDGIIYNDTSIDDSWDAVWTSAVTVDEGGWTVEMRIPFSQLRFPAAERHTFGINVLRQIQRKNERDWLVYVPKTENGLASRMAHLTGFEGLVARRGVELLPYFVSRAEYVNPAAGDPFNDGARVFGGTGIDLKYRVTSSLTLDGAVNPDFGQVEVDPAVVNLTAFETFFQEKRPFFIEGANIFSNFGYGGANNFWGFNRSEPNIFYSRRIGRAPQGQASGDFVDMPSSSTILGAAKLTGKTRNGWSLGFLDAVTGRERAHVVSNGQASRADVEPLSNYLVARVEREMGRRGAAGLLATAVSRDLRAPALRDRLVGQAYVAGADGHYFFDKKRDWVVTGRIAASEVKGSAPAITRLQEAPQRYYQRPDAPHVELDRDATSLHGWTGNVSLNRNSGIHGVNAALWGVSPGFDSNDAGFDFNNDRAGFHAVYSWNNPKVNRFARHRMFTISKWYTWNFARELQGDGLHSFARLQLKNYWSMFGGAYLMRAVQDDRATRGGPSMTRPAFHGAFVQVESDNRKRLTFSGELERDRGEDGGSVLSVRAGGRYRPAAFLEVSVSPGFNRQRLPVQYVTSVVDPAAAATFGSRYIFAHLDHREVTFETRVNYVLSPKLSLQIYMQPLVSVGDYASFKEFAQPHTYDFTRFGVDRGTLDYDAAARRYSVDPGDGGATFGFADPDFNVKSLRLNAIFRWEWRPGSAMYFVWTEQREDLDRPGRFGLRRDLGTLVRANANDVILFKIAWWLSR